RLGPAIGRPRLKNDPRFFPHPHPGPPRDEINGALAPVLGQLTLAELETRLVAFGVSLCPINEAAQVVSDTPFKAPDAIIEVSDQELGPVRMQAVVPRFSRTPGRVRVTGGSVGQHTPEVLSELGFGRAEIAQLAAQQVI